MLNQATIIGFVGKDPEVRSLANGNNVANFSIATTERWTDKETGEKKEITDWHNCVVFGKTADVAGEYVKKGNLLTVVGRLRTDKYEKDGVEQQRTKIIVDRLVLMPRVEKANGAQRQAPTTAGRAAPKGLAAQDDGFDDDIPF